MTGLTLGLIASYKGGLTTLKKTGQDQRLIHYYLQAYAKAFDRIYYFSYCQEQVEDFTSDPLLLTKVVVLSKPRDVPAMVYALGMPFFHWKAFFSCHAFRVFQALGFFPLLLPSLWRKPASLVTYGYRYTRFARVEGKALWKVAATWLTEQLAVRLAKVLLVTTPESFAEMTRRRGRKPVVLVPNGVDTDRFHQKNGSNDCAPREKVLLFVGRLEKQKNLPLLLEAVRLVQNRIPVQLWCVGQGSLQKELEQQARTLGVHLRLQPPVPHEELPALMRQADAFLLLSQIEGHPKVLLEAMSTALPCIVSDCEGNRTLVQPGETGFACPASNPSQIAQTIAQVLQDPAQAKRVGQNARLIILQRYDLRSWIQREILTLRALAEEAAARGRRHPFFTWLGYSYRRRWLDADLAQSRPWIRGGVLEIGGGWPRRGRFQPYQGTDVHAWVMLNRDPAAKPDLLADAAAIPTPSESVDTVVCTEVLEYASDPTQILREAHRVLKQNGHLLLSVPFIHPIDSPEDRWRFTREWFVKELPRVGFSIQIISTQGGILNGMLHMAKTAILNIPEGAVRWILLIGTLPFFEALFWLERFMIPQTPFWTRWTTGYLLVAQKTTLVPEGNS